nr:cellulose biosynthesis protein BcsS [Methyloceanibacter methanicus]
MTPFDPRNSVQGTELGLRLTLETWTDLSKRLFLSADASYGSAFQEYWELTRIGYRLGNVFAVGLEGGILGNQEYDAGRGGGFVRGTFKALEATLSGGFTGDYLLSEPSGYVALNLYRSF